VRKKGKGEEKREKEGGASLPLAGRRVAKDAAPEEEGEKKKRREGGHTHIAISSAQ